MAEHDKSRHPSTRPQVAHINLENPDSISSGVSACKSVINEALTNKNTPIQSIDSSAMALHEFDPPNAGDFFDLTYHGWVSIRESLRHNPDFDLPLAALFASQQLVQGFARRGVRSLRSLRCLTRSQISAITEDLYVNENVPIPESDINDLILFIFAPVAESKSISSTNERTTVPTPNQISLTDDAAKYTPSTPLEKALKDAFIVSLLKKHGFKVIGDLAEHKYRQLRKMVASPFLDSKNRERALVDLVSALDHMCGHSEHRQKPACEGSSAASVSVEEAKEPDITASKIDDCESMWPDVFKAETN